jgi:hypothetical protein
MANERWLKKAETSPVKNVSQSDVRRMQQEKQARLAAVENQPPDLPDTKTTQGGLRPPKTTQAAESPAPMRDFHKVANSINREAVPAGLFPGSSKKLYDALYLRTRGAIVPVKSVQATRRELSKWSGIKNIKTIASHLRHLSTVGLLIYGWDRGSTEGSTYEVRLPEEISGLRWSKTTLVPLSPPEVVLDQRSVLPLDQKSDLGGLSQVVDSFTTSDNTKTSFKTKEENFDDEALRQLVQVFLQAEKELTGKNRANSVQWRELAEILVTELKIAAGRTTVSNVPAFLAEHLRRRLWKVDKKRATEIAIEPEQGTQPPLSDLEKRSCPDCAGTNFWYPDGPDKGVAKCKHAKLILAPVDKE